MHVDFDPVNVNWEMFMGGAPALPGADLLHGAGCNNISFGGGGSGAQWGAGAPGYSVFTGMPYQRGAGVGAVFRTLMRYLLPIGRQMVGAIGREGLETGSRVLTGYLDGKNLKETMVHESKAGLRNLLDKAAQKLDSDKPQGGKGFDFKHYKQRAPPSAAGGGGGNLGKKSIKRLHSLFGPPSLPNTPLRGGKNRKNKNSKSTKGKKQQRKQHALRQDALGFY